MLKSFSYGDTTVLFWKKVFENVKKYEILVNGKKAGKTYNTFFIGRAIANGEACGVRVIAILQSGAVEEVGEISLSAVKAKRDLNVAKFPYCAVGDGKTLNTKAIQRALDDCGKGDRVVIPSGVFLTGALRLHSDTELYIAKGGIIKGSAKKEDYLPKIRSRFEGWECESYSSLINVGVLDRSGKTSIQNVKICGEGKIIGGGEKLLLDILRIKGNSLKDKRQNLLKYQEELSADKEAKFRQRGRLINISNAKKVIISGLTLGFSPSWNVHTIYSEDIVICDANIISHGVWNGDGIDPDSTSNCEIFGCKFDTGDDCIAIKSGKNPEGNIIGIPTKNVDIFSCKIKKGRSHGIAVGSEVSGGIENVNVWDCDFSCSFFGLHIKTTKKRGGYIRNVVVKDSKISRVMIREVGYNDDGEGQDGLTDISGIKLSGVKIEYNGVDPNFGIEADSYLYANGFAEDSGKVRDIEFKGVTINNKEGLKEYDVRNCTGVIFNGKNIG